MLEKPAEKVAWESAAFGKTIVFLRGKRSLRIIWQLKNKDFHNTNRIRISLPKKDYKYGRCIRRI